MVVYKSHIYVQKNAIDILTVRHGCMEIDLKLNSAVSEHAKDAGHSIDCASVNLLAGKTTYFHERFARP